MSQPPLDDLRRQARDLVRAEAWSAFLALEGRLRGDTEFWWTLWAPACAVAARLVGRPDARQLLDEAVAAGFNQPEILEPTLSTAFGADPDWDRVLAAMAANVPPPALELLAWPTITPTAPLVLFRLPAAREDELRARLPVRDGGAWRMARDLLRWVTTMWVHDNVHIDGYDGIEVLDRVAAGERFACREYTLLLTEALNAAGLPARQVTVRTATAHTGVGGGHVVSEAWVDELGRWVLLDGRNGLYWVDADGAPLGLRELHLRHAAGGPRPGAVFLGKPLPDADLDMWWTFYGEVWITGATWSTRPVAPLLEGAFVDMPPLLRSVDDAYMDLSEVAVSIEARDGGPALRVHTRHPYATGFRVGDAEVPLGGAWPLPRGAAGEYTVELSVVTPFGPSPGRPLTYRLR
ncbi:hypothetical protein Lfu02_63000 [Longispora fulva]|uniref:Transglutaminase-like domain-containing protein n=1 Tax=Longispora fulva TaxID=619741 RepID=A0A8J7KG96_9ACTN|nr:transglutaminase-like domain-containing protein [Longispora fulva]MBG6134719.1 hypothetical protein [Longispora fulva]GIG61928.1 hypothetical protein Lfu02_63000 [Longispora fulva]